MVLLAAWKQHHSSDLITRSPRVDPGRDVQSVDSARGSGPSLHDCAETRRRCYDFTSFLSRDIPKSPRARPTGSLQVRTCAAFRLHSRGWQRSRSAKWKECKSRDETTTHCFSSLVVPLSTELSVSANESRRSSSSTSTELSRVVQVGFHQRRSIDSISTLNAECQDRGVSPTVNCKRR